MLARLIENFVLKATDWWFHIRSFERYLITAAFGLLVAIFGGAPLIALVLRLALGAVPPEYQSALAALDLVDQWILTICTIVILVALALAIARFKQEADDRMKQRVVVIEARGLRDDDGSPLIDAVSEVRGQRIPLLLDLRNRMDGKVIEPERAVEDIVAAHRSLLQHQRNVDRSDLTTVYGGLTPVPYTFLTGVLFDDESVIKVYDWDRMQGNWRPVCGADDQLSFDVTGLNVASSTDEVILAVGFSYPVDEVDIRTTFTHRIVRMTLQGMSSDAHWSDQKQNRLAQQFLEVIKQLSAQAVKQIHLVLAAPNSVVFTFGRRYDKRNLPEIVVYQYERGKTPAYPWGLVMPVSGIKHPSVAYSTARCTS